jgi:5-methylcytosine-specific restriction protein B
MADDLGPLARDILLTLRDSKNVLISGPPGTGKSKLLSDLKFAFEQTPPPPGAAAAPVHERGAKIPFPARPPETPPDALQQLLPSPTRKNRKVFPTAFHQGTKYRDFITGIVPVVKPTEKDGAAFRILTGTLYDAAEFAKQPDSAALIIIDEINRGPAIQIFGGSIVAIEADKRLAPDGAVRRETSFFDITNPETGELLSYALPHDLYIVAAMNQADASVEPLDVAFLRRFVPFALEPSPTVLRSYFGRPEARVAVPDVPANEGDVYEAAIQAWEAVNSRIQLGRGSEFQIGHGVLMSGDTVPTDIEAALVKVASAWKAIRAHIDEVFFGDTAAIAETLNVGNGPNPYSLAEVLFAGEPRMQLAGPTTVTKDDIYELLRAVGR